MILSTNILTIIITSLFIICGTYYRYWVIKAKFELGYYVIFLFLAFSAATGAVYFLGGLDFIFNNSSLLHYNIDSMKPIIFVGSLGSIIAGIIIFLIFLRTKANLISLIKGPNKPKSKK